MGAMDGKGPDHLRPGQVGRTARSRIRPFPLCIIALSRNASCLHLSFNHSQSAFFGQGPPSRYPLNQGVHRLAHEHDALLELNKSSRGSPWTAISRFNLRSYFRAPSKTLGNADEMGLSKEMGGNPLTSIGERKGTKNRGMERKTAEKTADCSPAIHGSVA